MAELQYAHWLGLLLGLGKSFGPTAGGAWTPRTGAESAACRPPKCGCPRQDCGYFTGVRGAETPPLRCVTGLHGEHDTREF